MCGKRCSLTTGVNQCQRHHTAKNDVHQAAYLPADRPSVLVKGTGGLSQSPLKLSERFPRIVDFDSSVAYTVHEMSGSQTALCKQDS